MKGHVDLTDLRQQVEAFKRRMYERGDGDKLFNIPEFIENHLKLKDIKGQIREFKMNSAQDKVWQTMQWLQERDKMIRLLILKIRQLGISTFIEAWMFIQCWASTGQTGLITAHNWPSTLWIYEMSSRFYELMPQDMKDRKPLETPKPKVKELKFAEPHDSRIWVGTAASIEMGHGMTMQYWHGSEAARYRNGAVLLAGIGNTIHDVEGTAKIMETTAEGEDPFFYHHWKDAEAGENEYFPLFLGLKEYGHIRAKDYAHMKPLKLREDELVFQKEHELPDNIIQFVARKKRSPDCDNNWALLNQQFPATPKLAFSESGRSAFNLEALDEQEQFYVRDPSAKGNLEWAEEHSLDVRVETDVDRPTLEIYEWPEWKFEYIVTVDVGEGIGLAWTIGHVWKVRRNQSVKVPLVDKTIMVTTFEQVAKYCSNWIDVWTAGLNIFQLGILYNWAYIGVERNNHGLLIVKNLEHGFAGYPQTEGGYPYQYYQTRQTDRDEEETGTLGWATTPGSKDPMIAELSKFILYRQMIYHSARTVREHRGFYLDDKKKYQQKHKDKLTGERYDDEVMGAAILAPVYRQWAALPRLLPKAKIEGF